MFVTEKGYRGLSKQNKTEMFQLPLEKRAKKFAVHGSLKLVVMMT